MEKTFEHACHCGNESTVTYTDDDGVVDVSTAIVDEDGTLCHHPDAYWAERLVEHEADLDACAREYAMENRRTWYE